MADFGFQTSQASGTSGIGGSGTTNYVSKFTAASTIGDSQIFDNATNVGIGTITPSAKLDISSASSSAFRVSTVATFNDAIIQSDQYSASFSINASTGVPVGGYNAGIYLNSLGVKRGSFNSESTTSITTLESAGSYWLLLKNGTAEHIGLGQGGNYIQFATNSVTNMLIEGSTGNVAIGTALTPTARLHIKGFDATLSNFALKVENSASASLLSVRNDGIVDIYGTITPRLQSIVSSATVTPTNLNDEVVITAQATGLTLVNPTGTAVQGQSMIIRIKDNGTARTIGYDTQYRAIGVTLPTTTVINKTVYLGLIYNSTDTKWDVIGVSQEA